MHQKTIGVPLAWRSWQHGDDLMADKELDRVDEAMTILSLKRSTIDEQLRCGRLRSVHVGRTRLIPATAITEYVALLEDEAAGTGQFGVAS